MRINKTWTERIAKSQSSSLRVGRYLLVGLAALGGLHVMWNFFFGQPDDFITPARQVLNKGAVISSFAQDCISTLLRATTADAGSVAGCVTVEGQSLRLPSTPGVVISAPTVVASTFEGYVGKDDSAELFSVVIGVNERAYESAPPTRALYCVPVLWSKFGPRATSLPFRVEGPGPGADLPMAYRATLGPADQAYQVVSGFISAYLTGSGEVSRYVTADSMLSGLGAPYQNVLDSYGRPAPLVTQVVALSPPTAVPTDGQTARVLAHVTALTPQFAPVNLTYPLTLRGVGGHWSVAAIDPAPAMSHDDDLVPVAGPPQARR